MFFEISEMNVVFDFGNVLFEWNPVALINAHLPAAKLRDQDASELANAMLSHADWLAFDRGELDSGQVAASLAAHLAVDEKALSSFFQTIPHALPPIASTIDVANALCERSGGAFGTYYLSNMPAEFADTLEAKYDWIAHFDGGIFSGRERLSKPDVAIYRAMESRFGLRGETTLFLDDSVANIGAARACGWFTHHISSPQSVFDAMRRFELLDNNTLTSITAKIAD
jgi:putative hydrolase of the HAD superfamily